MKGQKRDHQMTIYGPYKHIYDSVQRNLNWSDYVRYLPARKHQDLAVSLRSAKILSDEYAYFKSGNIRHTTLNLLQSTPKSSRTTIWILSLPPPTPRKQRLHFLLIPPRYRNYTSLIPQKHAQLSLHITCDEHNSTSVRT